MNRDRYFLSIDPDINTKSSMPLVNKRHRRNLHLTLNYLGPLDKNQVKVIDKQLRAVKSRNKELVIKYNDLGDFDNRFLHTKVKPTRRLKSLYSDIINETGYQPSRQYVPHITLAPHLSLNDLPNKPKVKGSFKANKITLYKISPNDKNRFEKVRTYKLKNRNIWDKLIDFVYD